MNERTYDGAPDGVLDALKSELASVSVSPDFATNVRRRIEADAETDAVGALARELSSVSVSPEFAVRVRQQIETAPSHSRVFGWFNWRWAVPVAAAAAIVAFVLTRGAAPTTGGVDPAGVQARDSEPQAPQVPQVPQAPQAPSITSNVPNAPVSQPSPVETARVNQRTTSAAAASGQQADDKLEVITNQPAILRQLWAAVTPVEVTEARVETRELVIAPVEVTPVAVQWLVEPPQSGGSAPIIRRVSADAERSDK